MARRKPGRSRRKRPNQAPAKVVGATEARPPILATKTKGLAWVVLAVAIILGGFLRIRGAAQSPTITNDEGISLLAATGHQGEYATVLKERQYPYAVWSRSAEWKRFILPEKRFCFGTISADLARHDLHPPLYFWILHVWILAFGVHPWVGLCLNLIFFTLSAIMLYVLGARALADRIGAAAGVFLWCCSPTVLPSAYEFRQYDLLALCTIGFTLLVLRCTREQDPPRWWHYTLLGSVGAAGLLTHYHFVVALAGGGLYALFWLIRRHRGRLAIGALSILIGFGAANLCHPVVGHVIDKSAHRGAASVTPGQRLGKAYNRYRAFIMDDAKMLSKPARRRYVQALPYVFWGACGSMAALAIYRRRKRSTGDVKGPSYPGSLIFFLLWYAAGNVGLYVSGVSPPHAMAAKYPCMAWPFLAFLPILLTVPLPKLRVPIQLMMCAGMALSGSLHLRWDLSLAERLGQRLVRLPWNAPLVVSNPHRLRLPRLLFRLPDDIPMLVASSEELLAEYDRWSGNLAQQNVYLGYTSSRDSPSKPNELLTRLGRDFRFQPGKIAIAGYNVVGTLIQK